MPWHKTLGAPNCRHTHSTRPKTRLFAAPQLPCRTATCATTTTRPNNVACCNNHCRSCACDGVQTMCKKRTFCLASPQIKEHRNVRHVVSRRTVAAYAARFLSGALVCRPNTILSARRIEALSLWPNMCWQRLACRPATDELRHRERFAALGACGRHSATRARRTNATKSCRCAPNTTPRGRCHH